MESDHSDVDERPSSVNEPLSSGHIVINNLLSSERSSLEDDESSQSSNDSTTSPLLKAVLYLEAKVESQQETIDSLIATIQEQRNDIDDIYQVYGDLIADIKIKMNDPEVNYVKVEIEKLPEVSNNEEEIEENEQKM